MLTIRKEQVQVFDELAMKQFIENMMIHVRKYFPIESKAMDDGQLRKNILEIIQRAGEYELITERDICKFLNISIFFGMDFDKKPENAWMLAILMDKKEPNPSIRIGKLYQEVLKRSDENKKLS